MQQLSAQKLVSLIKHDEEIYKVEQVANTANVSVRAVQRYFADFVGVSPKWLIRRYRLRRALEGLESNSESVLDIVSNLAYSDQSHLIRDFQQILGISPSKYLKIERSSIS